MKNTQRKIFLFLQLHNLFPILVCLVLILISLALIQTTLRMMQSEMVLLNDRISVAELRMQTAQGNATQSATEAIVGPTPATRSAVATRSAQLKPTPSSTPFPTQAVKRVVTPTKNP